MKAIRERVGKLIHENTGCGKVDAERLAISVLRMVGKVRRTCIQKNKIKLNTINVIEIQTDDNEIIGIRSFVNSDKGRKAAEKLFEKLCRENSETFVDDFELSQFLLDDEFEEGSYKVVIV